MTKPTFLQELREAAEKATAGPWWTGKYAGENDFIEHTVSGGKHEFIIAYACNAYKADKENNQFIAQANPQTMLTLLNAIDKYDKFFESFTHGDECPVYQDEDDEDLKCDCGIQDIQNLKFLLSQGPPNEPKQLDDGKENK